MKKIVLNQLALIVLVASMLTGCNSTSNPETLVLKNYNDSLSYILGADYANVLMSNGFEVNSEAVYAGFYSKMNGIDRFPDSVKIAFVNEFNIQTQARQQEQIAAQVMKNKEDGAAFMAQNQLREGVRQMPDGLQYRILKAGNGPNAQPGDSVLIHYRAMFIDGTTFDESYQRGPQGVKLEKLTPGLSEGIQLMNKGSIYELFIPSDLAYGDQGIPNVLIGGVSLIYSVELIEIY